MHLRELLIHPEKFPENGAYPFNLGVLRDTPRVEFSSAVTIFAGENGTGKSTLLEALARKCGITIWGDGENTLSIAGPRILRLAQALSLGWTEGSVPGSYFSSRIFSSFTRHLDEWAVSDPGMLDYFSGEGRSLESLSHGESLMAYFRSRYRVRGIYLMDEPETALSPKSQVSLSRLLQEMSEAGHAQFIMATHSPILMSIPGATIYSFDSSPLKTIKYEQTEHYRVYSDFMLKHHHRRHGSG